MPAGKGIFSSTMRTFSLSKQYQSVFDNHHPDADSGLVLFHMLSTMSIAPGFDTLGVRRMPHRRASRYRFGVNSAVSGRPSAATASARNRRRPFSAYSVNVARPPR